MEKRIEEKKTTKLTVYLLRDIPNLTFKRCLRSTFNINIAEYNLKESLNINGIIYIGNTEQQEPRWKALLQQGTDKEIPSLINSSNRAVLLLKVESRIFAITFGYGQYLLDDSLIERNFGLKTSLNSINVDKLRSMDKAKLDELTVQTRIQSSIVTDRGAFDIDVVGDLLRSITGEIEIIHSELGNVITGTDAVYISPKINFSDIQTKVKRLYNNYSLSNYKENFDWIDNLSHEKDNKIINDLTDNLLEDIKRKDIYKVSLVPPEILDWASYNGVSFTPKGNIFTDLDVNLFYNYKTNLDTLTIDKLKTTYLYFEDGFSENRVSFPILKCLNYQVEYKDSLYVRTLGKWYKISKTFSDRIIDETSKIKESKSAFIECQSDWNEETYNTELAASKPDNYVCFDRKLVKCEAANRSIEPCDILTDKKELIHVKPRNSSSTLSHLFSQGRISAIALNSDRKFRIEMRKIIRKERQNSSFLDNVIPVEKINNADYTITYAQITKDDRSMVKTLPFFSLLNLRQSQQFLSEHGFSVRIKKIKKQ